MTTNRSTITLTIGLAIAGCSGLPLDPSMSAVEAGDFTLVASACEAIPSRGIDVCHVKEGAEISSSWRLVVPHGMKEILGGEVNVYYRDISRSYAVTGAVIEIPWKDFFQQTFWSRELDGEALALVLIRWKNPDTQIEEVVKFRGIAKIVVTSAAYDRMPIDSGFAAFGTKCKIQYSTAGRSAISCK